MIVASVTSHDLFSKIRKCIFTDSNKALDFHVLTDYQFKDFEEYTQSLTFYSYNSAIT